MLGAPYGTGATVICDLGRAPRAAPRPRLRPSAQIRATHTVPAMPEMGSKAQVGEAKVPGPPAGPPRISKKALMTRCATLPVDLPSDMEQKAVAAHRTAAARGSRANED